MVALLEKAFNKLSALPTEEQERFAQWILEELEDEQKWDELFTQSQDILAQMAAKARANRKAG